MAGTSFDRRARVLAPKRPCLPVLASDPGAPPARAHGSVSDAAQKVAAENLTSLAHSDGADGDGVKHDGGSVAP